MNKQDLINLWKDLWLKQSDIEKIIQKEAELSSGQLFLLKEVEDKYIENIKNSFDRLKKWEPLEYILNKAEFYWLDFYVDSRVLIPRNDTEVMVKEVIKIITPPLRSSGTPLKKGRLQWDIVLIDVWTWSWVIPISILKNTDKVSKCYAIEIWKDALEVVRINVEMHGLQDKIELIKWDLLNTFIPPSQSFPLQEEEAGQDIIITANLPYIRTWDYKNMDSEVIFYEPDLALYWWEKTGFELYEKLINQCIELFSLLSKEGVRGWLFIEIWYDQYDYSKNYLEKSWLKFEYFKDNSWAWRCLEIEF